MKKKLYFLSTIMIVFLSLFMMTSCGNSSGKDSEIGQSTIVPTTESTTPDNPTDTTNEKYYTVTFKDYDGTVLQTSEMKEGSTPSYNGVNPTRNSDENFSYTFYRWIPSISKVTEDVVYTATYSTTAIANDVSFKVEHYLQNVDGTYPTTPYEIDNKSGVGLTTLGYASIIKIYEGFYCVEYNNPRTPKQFDINSDGSTVIKLHYSRVSRSVTLNTNNENAGTVTGSGWYKYGEEITITAQTNLGYTFNGWYKNNELYTENASFEYEVEASDVTFEARYTPNKYKITIDNQAEGVMISGITSGNSYEYNTQITLTAVDIPSDKKLVWYFNDVAVAYGNNSYSFYVPSKDITIKLILADTLNDIAYTRDENKIYFGTYPQTKVTDNTLISELNTLAGSLPTSSNKANWTDYNYYISSSVTSFMYYQDIDYDNNGIYDYRGVYFTSYRPHYYSYSSSNSYQDDNGYTRNTVYWFTYDPIEWNILTESSGKALIIANLILDSQDYYPNSSSSSFSHNGGEGYANNYELSNIRKFLNDNFYNTAFNDLQKELIEITEVDNSASSTASSSNGYACNNTNDKMFLLSYKEVTTYYTSDSARTAKGSDYAKCQGL